MTTKATDLTRVYCLGLFGLMVDDAFARQQALTVERHYEGDWDAFAAEDESAIAKPTQRDLAELVSLINDTSPVPYNLGYEDKQYLAEVRSFLLDALQGCFDGDIDVAADQLEKAFNKLDFITYGRKRQDKRDYHNPWAAMKPTFERLTMRSSQLYRRFGAVSVSA